MRKTLVAVHRWVGLAAALLLLSQGLSGAALAFRAELNRILHHDALTVAPLPSSRSLQSLLDTVREAHPDLYVERIEFPRREDEALLFRLETRGAGAARCVTVDPYRGVITRDATLSGWPLEWLFRLHQQLLAGERGERVVGITGAALLLLCAIGPFLWWPGRCNLRRGFTISFAAGSYRTVRDLHRVVGIALVLVLGTSASTGMTMAWKAELQTAAARVLPIKAKPAVKVAPRTDRALLPMDEIVAAARQRFGGAPVKNVRFPGGGHGRVVAVFLQTTATSRPRASDQIWFDGYTAAELGTYEVRSLPPGNAFFDLLVPVHTGEMLGSGGRVLFLIGALCLPGFVVTGAWQWWKRRRLQREPLARPSSAAAAPTLQVVVDHVWDETAQVRALELRAADGSALPAFTAGAHIDVHFAQELIRQYSLWGEPNERHCYRIAVLDTPQSRGGARAAHALRPGMTLRISQPRNAFELGASDPFALLIAGGIGITPILAMASELARLGKPFAVHYCARGRAAAAFAERLRWAAGEAAATLHLSDEPDPGRIDLARVLGAAPAGTHIYVCGPDRLIRAVFTAADSLGWDRDRLHFELFSASLPGEDAAPFDLVLARSRRTVHVPAGCTALDALTAAGVAPQASCRAGVCGTCVTGVLDGIPDHRDRFLSEAEHASNVLFTPCCSRARTPALVIDL